MGTYQQQIKELQNDTDLLWREVRALRQRMARNWEENLAVILKPPGNVVVTDGRNIAPATTGQANLGTSDLHFGTVYADNFTGGSATVSDAIADQDGGANIEAARSAHANMLLALNGSGQWPSSTIPTIAHSSLSGVSSDQHHAQQHVLAGSDHTASGLTTGYVVRASGATTFAWARLQHNDLGGVGTGDHHAQLHALTGSDHTASGLTTGYVVRASGATTFAWAQLQHGDLGGVNPDDHHNPVTIGVGELSSHLSLSTQVLTLTDINHNELSSIAPNDHHDPVTAGNGIAVSVQQVSVDLVSIWSGLGFSGADLRVDLGANFTWTGAHEFQAGATITAGQWLNFGADVGLSRKGADVLQLNSGDAFESPTFTSGLVGWEITAAGNAEFNNIVARGELRASIFTIGEMHANGGTFVVLEAGVLSEQVTTSA